MHQDISLEWHYSKDHRERAIWKALVQGCIENVVFRRVMSGNIVINDPKDFATFFNKFAQIQSFFLASEEVLKEQEETKSAVPNPETLRAHKVVRETKRNGVFWNNFFTLARK